MYLKLVLLGFLFHWGVLEGDAWNIPIPGSNHDSSHATNTMIMDILTECYADYQEIAIHGDSDESTIKSIRDTESFAVIMFNEISMINETPHPRTKVNVFLMTPRSNRQLRQMLLTFKKSLWWNIKSPFFILDRSNKKCNNARNMLKSAWKMNIVKSFFLCINSDQIQMVYSYNPYTNRAPEPWKEIQSTTKQSHGWTLYARRHQIGNICDSINFDRTKNLDGSLIKVAMNMFKDHEFDLGDYYDDTLLNHFHGNDIDVAKAMKPSLNATLWVVLEEAEELLKRLQNGSADVAVWSYGWRDEDFEQSYPVQHSKYHIVTNNRGVYTPLEKIRNYYGSVTLISMVIILAMTFTVIVLSGTERRWAFAMFEVIRLLINAAVLSKMDRLSTRIFFTMIFLYFLVIQATFSGHLVAFLTEDEPRSNVETLEDLKNSRYDTILSNWPIASGFTDPMLKKKWQDSDLFCVSQLVGNKSTVCITDIDILLEPAFEHKMHVSKHPIGTNVYIYLIRDDWPLKEKFDIFLMRLEQCGHQRRLDMDREKEIARQKRIIAQLEVRDRPISLDMLDFIFIFLLIGLKVASMSFLCERRIGNEAMIIRRREAIRNAEIARINQTLANIRRIEIHSL